MRSVLEKINEKNTGVCIGLDPDLTKIPNEIKGRNKEDKIKLFLEEVIEITKEFSTAYKIQKAYFDMHEGGKKLLHEIINYIRINDPNKAIIIDAKIGDTSNTMKAYLDNIFNQLDADAVTVNPYMGGDVFTEFKKYPDRGIVLLTRTSNETASEIQDIKINNNQKYMWEHVLETAFEKWNYNKNIIPVLSSYSDLSNIRKKIGNYTPILYAGVGFQGGDLKKVKQILNHNKSGVIINSSREILFPYSREDKLWREKIYNSTKQLFYKIAEMKK